MAPYFSYSIKGPKTLFQLLRPYITKSKGCCVICIGFGAVGVGGLSVSGGLFRVEKFRGCLGQGV